MNKIALLVCVAFLIAIPSAGWCYGINTHESLTEAAAKASALGTSDVLGRIGISGPIDGPPTIAKTFPDSKGTSKTVLKLISEGAVFEDQPATNVRNHFYNPINGAPLRAGIVDLGCPSPDWALEDNAQINTFISCGNQEFSYADARQYLFNALTKFTELERDKNFGLAFESLGHIVHHLQDMAQPQHVRSDQHLELPYEQTIAGGCGYLAVTPPFVGLAGCLAYLTIRNPSAYEAYTDRVRESPQFLDWLSSATPVYGEGVAPKFFKPRDFWLGANGIATFTNRNMLSAGTNFNNFGVNLLPDYDPTGDLVVDIKTLVPGTTLHGLVRFYATRASNPELGDIANPLASSSSLFDWDLTKLEGNPRSPKRVFSLNRINYDIAQTFLIPRAVGYSAGLINYFFRGNIDFVLDPSYSGKYLIKNLSNEKMKGTFTLYYDDKDGKRYETPNKWELEIAANQSSSPLLLEPMPPGSAEPDVPGRYMLVFNGAMGEETAGSDTPATGAVAAKQVDDPLMLSFGEMTFLTCFPPCATEPLFSLYPYRMKKTSAFRSVFEAGKDKIKLVYKGAHFTDSMSSYYVYRNDLFFHHVAYNVSNFIVNISADSGVYGGLFSDVMRFDMGNMPDSTATISLMIDDVTLVSFTYVPESLTDYSPVKFVDAFHLDTRGMTNYRP